MTNMQFISADTVFILGGGGTTTFGGYYLTSNKGNSWTYHSLNLPQIAFGQMLNSYVGFTVTRENPDKLFRFTTSSNSPELIFTADTNETIVDFGFTAEFIGYILCHSNRGSNLYSTQDGGLTWNYVGTFPYLNKLKVFSNLNGFAYGTADRLLKLQDGYPVGLPEVAKAELTKLQLHPNPADKLVWIKLNDTDIAFPLKLEIVDVQGKVVFDKQINTPAELLQPLSVNQFNDGFYLLRIFTNKKTWEAKLIVSHMN